jgi:hypothetical protein
MNLYLGDDISIANLFRAVSQAELNDVTNFGGLRQKPDGLSYEGKLFATSAEDAAHFGRINYRLDIIIGLDNPFHVIEVSVPEALMHRFEFRTVDFMPAVYVIADLLPLLNRHAIIREISVVPLAR